MILFLFIVCSIGGVLTPIVCCHGSMIFVDKNTGELLKDMTELIIEDKEENLLIDTTLELGDDANRKNLLRYHLEDFGGGRVKDAEEAKHAEELLLMDRSYRMATGYNIMLTDFLDPLLAKHISTNALATELTGSTNTEFVQKSLVTNESLTKQNLIEIFLRDPNLIKHFTVEDDFSAKETPIFQTYPTIGFFINDVESRKNQIGFSNILDLKSVTEFLSNDASVEVPADYKEKKHIFSKNQFKSQSKAESKILYLYPRHSLNSKILSEIIQVTASKITKNASALRKLSKTTECITDKSSRETNHVNSGYSSPLNTPEISLTFSKFDTPSSDTIWNETAWNGEKSEPDGKEKSFLTSMHPFSSSDIFYTSMGNIYGSKIISKSSSVEGRHLSSEVASYLRLKASTPKRNPWINLARNKLGTRILKDKLGFSAFSEKRKSSIPLSESTNRPNPW